MSLLREIASYGVAHGASDIHLSAYNVPSVRIDGQIVKLDGHALSKEEMDEIAKECIGRTVSKNSAKPEIGHGIELSDISVSVSIFRQSNGISIAMRFKI